MVTTSRHGHIIIQPCDFAMLTKTSKSAFIRNLLLPGTPMAFGKIDLWFNYREQVSKALGIHSSSIIVRGSGKLGFSMAPRSGKVWMEIGAKSDLDLAIIDPDIFNFLDLELRAYERAIPFFKFDYNSKPAKKW